MKRCGNCMGLYEDEMQKCPICGYEKDEDLIEPQYLRQGTILNSRYEIGRVIGAGGFGITYAAWDLTLQQKIAVKEYMPGEFSTRTYGETRVSVYGGEKTEQFLAGCEKFQDESQRLAKMRNVNGIVQIFDSFEENGTAYIVMEYLEGETLEQRLKREGKLSEREAVDIMKPVLAALIEVHKEGILHRDIAPNNIFLCRNGEVKLLDFGAARSVTGTHSKSLTVLYKEGYTPEEQYRSRGDQGPWTDVYASAATFYRMVTGRVPVGAMERRRKDTLKKPSRNGARVGKNVDLAVMNALNVTIEGRTQRAEEFLNELTGIVKPRKHYIRTIEKKIGRIPTWIKLSSGIVFLAIIAFFIMLQTGVIHFDIAGFGNFLLPDGKARVMNVVNMDETRAYEALERAGLQMKVEERIFINNIAEGTVIEQSVEKGVIVDKGTEIEVVVSKHAEIVSVPDMVGKKWQDVQGILDELCIGYNVKEIKGVEVPGYVLAQKPEPDTEVEQGTIIDVNVSKGNDYDPAFETEATDLIGLTFEEARQLAAESQLYLQISGYGHDDTIAADLIMSQSVQPGTLLHGGDIVDVTISMGIEQVEVPELIGLTSDEAVARLEELKFTPVLNEVLNQKEMEGTILSQSQDAGLKIDKYSEVVLEVCIHGIEVPDLVGKTYDEAKQLAKGLKLNVKYNSDGSGNGTITRQNIAVGTLVERESELTVTLGVDLAEFTSTMLSLINGKRQEKGYGALALDETLVAEAKYLHSAGFNNWQPQYPYNYTYGYILSDICTPQEDFKMIQNSGIVTKQSYTSIGIYALDKKITIVVKY